MEAITNILPKNDLFLQQLKSCTDVQVNNPDESARLETFRLLNTRFKLMSLDDRFGDNLYKKPIDKEWQNIYKEPGYLPKSKNRCGLPTGKFNNLLVIDVDDLEKFLQFLDKHNIPRTIITFTVKTGNGYHLYFLYPNDGREYRNLSRKDTEGYDVRGEGGYVLAPGSLHPVTGTVYQVVGAHEIAQIPPKLLEALYEKQQNIPEIKTPLTAPVVSIDMSAKIATLPSPIQELILHGKPKPQRSEASWTVLLSLMSRGFSEDEIKAIYWKYPIGEKARERASSHWLEGEIERARKYLASNQLQNQSPNLPEKIDPINNNYEYGCVSANTLIKYSTPQEYMIESFLPKNGLLIIHGKPGTFKTHIALQVSVALLNPNESMFLGTFPINNEFRPKNILILNGENADCEIKQKLEMIQFCLSPDEKSAINDRIQFMSLKNTVTFCDTFDNTKFVDSINRIIKEKDIDLLIIDNLQCYNENDENDNTKMRQLLNKLTNIRAENDLTLILIHHSGKGDAKEVRGASSIKDWASNIVSLEDVKDTYELHNTKNRSSGKFPTLKLKFDGYRLVLADPSKAINHEDIITSVMKQQPYGCVDSQDKLIKLIQSHTMKNNQNLSIQAVKNMIESAVASGKLNKTKGNANSNIYRLPIPSPV